MEFNLTNEQELLRDSARRFLADVCDEEYVRQAEHGFAGRDIEIWSQMTDLGWHRIASTGVEELVNLCILVQEMGRCLLPGPFLPNALCCFALALAADHKQQDRLLPGLVQGSAIHSYGVIEEAGQWDLTCLDAIACEAEAGGFRLNGKKLCVPNGRAAAFLHIFGRSRDADLMDFIIPGDSAGVRIADLRAIEGEGQANVALQDVYVPQENVLLLDASTWREIANAGACLESAYLVGLAQRDFELTVNYAKQRKQFGSPIGSFQAVQHMCADSAVELDGMEMLMHEAAWAVRNGSPSRDLTVAMAKSWCSDASRRIVARGQQIHGAAGYSHESIIQLYFRHQRRPSFSWGSADYQRERIAALVGGLWSA